MPEKNKQFDSKINQIINDLQKLDASEIAKLDSQQKYIIDFSEILSNNDAESELAIGTTIGQWSILKLLGKGGMSIVYLVERNDDQLKQKAALKIIPNAIASKNMIERFIRERQILSDLNHNNIAKLYDAGITEKKIPWLVMELVEGDDIITFADYHQFNIEQKIVLIQQACEALSYAHAKGVIHRDIKPSNLMVNQDKVLKLLDFGIASMEQQQSLTMTGTIIGTPGYMSPEQAKGMSHELDRRTDIFSMGVLLYKLTQHQMPFKADNISDISNKIIHDEPSAMVSKVPVDLEAIIFKCLEKKIEDRYSSFNQLNQDLKAYLNGDVVSAKKTTFIGRIRKKIKKHPIMSAFITTAVLATFIGIGYGLFQTYALMNKIQIAEKYLSQSQEIKAKIRRTHMMPLHNIQAEYDEISDDIEYLREQIESMSADISGVSDFALGSAYLSMRKYELANKYLKESENKGWDSPELSSALGMILSYKWDDIKTHAISFSDKKQQEKYLQERKIAVYLPAIKYLKEATKGLSTSNFQSAYLAMIENDLDTAIKFIEKEMTINPWHYQAFAFASDIYSKKSIPIINNQGYTYADKYLKLVKQRMSQAINIGRSDPKNYADYCANFGVEIQLKLLYEPDDLINTFNQGLAICKQALMLSPHPKPASIFQNISYLYSQNGENQKELGHESVALYKQAHNILQQGLIIHPQDSALLMATVSPLIAMAKNNIKQNKSPVHYYNSALSNIEKSLAINITNRTSWHKFAILQKDLGNYYKDNGNYQQANDYYEKSISSHRKVIELGNKFSGLANISLVLNQQAKLKFLMGKPNQGIELIRQALITSDEIFEFNKEAFVIYSNYFEYQYELVKALDENNLSYTDELLKAVNAINDACKFDYLKASHFNQIEDAIKLYIENNYSEPIEFKVCQSQLNLARSLSKRVPAR